MGNWWILSGHQRKRTRADGNDSAYGAPLNKAPFKIGQSNSFDFIGSMIGNYVSTQYFEMSSLLHSSGTAKLNSDPGSSKMVVCKEHSVEVEVNRRKRARLPSWQRRKRCKRPMLQDNTEEPFTKVANNKGNLCNICQCNVSNNGHHRDNSIYFKQMHTQSQYMMLFEIFVFNYLT